MITTESEVNENRRVARKKSTFPCKEIFESVIFLKSTDLSETITYIFGNVDSFNHFDYLFKSNRKAINQLFRTSC